MLGSHEFQLSDFLQTDHWAGCVWPTETFSPQALGHQGTSVASAGHP